MRCLDGVCGGASHRPRFRIRRSVCWLPALALAVVMAAGSAATAAGPPYQDSPISTVAGLGPSQAGYSGDGGPANLARLYLPFDVVAASDGSCYIADTFNNVVRKVDAAGDISTFAGTGTPGYSGDGGPATSAWLEIPEGVTLGPDGSLYIADSSWGVVRRVGLDGIINTVAGNPDSLEDPTQGAGDGGRADLAPLGYPVGLAFDSGGNLYIADWGADRIRRVAASGVTDGSGIISTFAGTGVSGYSGDGGPATSANLQAPAGLAFDSSDRLYIADSYNHVIRRVDGSGIITTVAGTGVEGYSGDGGAATAALLNDPNDVATDAYGNFYIVEIDNHIVRKVDSGGIISTVAGVGWPDYLDADRAVEGYMNEPMGVSIGPDGKMYIADTVNNAVRVVTPPTNQLPTCNITLSPPTAAWGESINFYSNASDPDGTVAGVAWDFGDGATASGLTTSHAYALPGTYTVTATVTDDQGGVGDCDTTVTISEWQLVSKCRVFTEQDLGWHLIALPLAPDDPDPYAVFASSGYDPSGRLYRYDPVLRSYVGLLAGDPLGFGDMDIHNGYWLSVEEPFTLCYVGRRYPPDNVSHSLAIGQWDWNWVLIGSGMEASCSLVTNAFVSHSGAAAIPFWDDDAGSSDAVHEGWFGLPIWGWTPAGYYGVSPETGSGYDYDTLDTWNGYWVDVEQSDLTLILTP